MTHIIRPSEIAILFGIPTSEEGYLRATEENRTDFVRGFVLPKYKQEVTQPFKRTAEMMKTDGAIITQDVTKEYLVSTVASGRFSVVVFMSHWHDQMIDFGDGAAHFADVAQALHIKHTVLDLCICGPVELVSNFRRLAPSSGLIRYSRTDALPSLWMYFYAAVIRLLKTNRLTYIQAFEEVSSRFLKRTPTTEL